MSGMNSLSRCCLSGKLHEGKPAGREDEIAGLQTYITEPNGGSKAKSLVFITDVFGWKTPNIRLLADEYAQAGFYCYVPDFHGGDSIPLDTLKNMEPPLKDRDSLTVAEKAKNAAIVAPVAGPWLLMHTESSTRPVIDAFVNALRTEPGTGKVGAVGFCWGGRYALLEGHGPQENEFGAKIGGVDAVYACHPSLLSIPADFEPLKVPFSIAVGSEDLLVGKDTIGQIQEAVGKLTDIQHELRVYDGQVHGFTLRGDWSGEADKKAMDEALQQGITWFNKHL